MPTGKNPARVNGTKLFLSAEEETEWHEGENYQENVEQSGKGLNSGAQGEMNKKKTIIMKSVNNIKLCDCVSLSLWSDSTTD